MVMNQNDAGHVLRRAVESASFLDWRVRFRRGLAYEIGGKAAAESLLQKF